MTMTKAAAQKQADYWQHRMGLCNWKVWWEWYNRERLPDDAVFDGRLGCCTSDPANFQATIAIAIKRSRAEVEETIVHELTHMMSAELRLWLDYLIMKIEQGEANVSHAGMARDAWLYVDEAVANRISRAVRDK